MLAYTYKEQGKFMLEEKEKQVLQEEEDAIVRNLLAGEKQDARMEVPKYHQMSLFDDTMPFADLPNMR